MDVLKQICQLLLKLHFALLVVSFICVVVCGRERASGAGTKTEKL